MIETFLAPIIRHRKGKSKWHFNSRVGCSLFELNYKYSGLYEYAKIEIELENEINNRGRYHLFTENLRSSDLCTHCVCRALYLYKNEREYFNEYISVESKP